MATSPSEISQEQLTLQLEHLFLLGRLSMVKAQQVEYAVSRQQEQLLDRRVASFEGLPFGHRWAQNDIAQHTLRRQLTVPTRPQLVHGEAHDVGRAGQVHPLHVEVFHRGFVGEGDT